MEQGSTHLSLILIGLWYEWNQTFLMWATNIKAFFLQLALPTLTNIAIHDNI